MRNTVASTLYIIKLLYNSIVSMVMDAIICISRQIHLQNTSNMLHAIWTYTYYKPSQPDEVESIDCNP